MQKVLFITIGGSPEPILTAIRTLQPDRIIFICSDDNNGAKGSKSQIVGEGKPCEIRRGAEVEKLPNIPIYLELGDRFQPKRDLVLLKDPDDLSECYTKIVAKIREIQQEAPDSEILAEYTGATKTMSASLAMATVDYRLPLYVTTTTRRNLIQVESGQLTERAAVVQVIVERTIDQYLPLFLQQYNYPAVIAELKAALQMELSPDLKRRLRDIYTCCIGFDAWDRFDHIAAWRSLSPYVGNKTLQPVLFFLKRVMSSREAFAEAVDDSFSPPDRMKGNGYEIVEDLLLNAERRAVLERYDDAVARLYRALELLAQTRLWLKHRIKTGNVDVEKLPETVQPSYEALRSSRKGRIEIALLESYTLLSQFSEEPLGKLYIQQSDAIKDCLRVRNYSILAHGLKPVVKSDFERIKNIIVPFVEEGITVVASSKVKAEAIQFPNHLNL